jgi:hypothetical protein
MILRFSLGTSSRRQNKNRRRKTTAAVEADYRRLVVFPTFALVLDLIPLGWLAHVYGVGMLWEGVPY